MFFFDMFLYQVFVTYCAQRVFSQMGKFSFCVEKLFNVAILGGNLLAIVII